MKSLRFLWLALFLAVASAKVSHAGLDNQPPPPETVCLQMNAAMNEYRKKGDNVASTRPRVLALVEANAATDFVYFMPSVFDDPATYYGIIATLEKAHAKADAKTKPFILYNIVRVHEMHADKMPKGAARIPFLDAARKAATRFEPTFQDPGLWAVKGDVENDAGNVDAAIADYEKMGVTGSGTPTLAYYRIGEVLQEAGRLAEAEAAFKKGISIDEASAVPNHEIRHYTYQALMSVYMKKSDYAQAASALTDSVRGVKAEPKPYFLMPYAAEELLKNHTYAKVVLDYADAALALNPDAPGMAELRDKAKRVISGPTVHLR